MILPRSASLLLISILISIGCQNPLLFVRGYVPPSQPDATTLEPPASPQIPGLASPEEQVIQEIELSKPLSDSNAEISGMAWFGNQLIMVPQFPGQYASKGNDGLLFALEKTDIQAYLAGDRSEPVEARSIPLAAPGLAKQIPGFEGFEAIAVDGEKVYLTIESSNGQPMMGYLIQGAIEPDLSRITLDPSNLIPLSPRARQVNKTDEALVLGNGQLYSLYEANGAELNPNPVAYRFDLPDLKNVESVPFPNIEFRITDATPTDSHGLFWAINTFWPIDIGVATDIDPLALKYGEGATHREFLTVERLVEMQIEADRILLTESAPIQLSLIDDFSARNWEGLARLDDQGFLLMTDEHPASIFAYVPYP